MTTQKAKNISIIDFLEKSGFKVIRKNRNNVFFNSPFRYESNASFKVDLNLNLYYDFGIGEGGSIIDLVCKMKNVNVSGALEILSKNEIKIHEKQNNSNEKKINYHFQKLQNKALIKYLEYHRKIPFAVAKYYLEECYYKDIGQKKVHFSLAFKNEIGTYELRNIFQKRSTGNYYTHLKGKDNTKINVFEGFMDFLSALVYYKKTFLKIDTLVLNSVSNKKNALEILRNYKKINLFLDNDQAGFDAKEFFKNELQNIEIEDFSHIYSITKDFNQFLINSINV